MYEQCKVVFCISKATPHLHPERNGTKVPPPSSLGPPAYIRLPRLLYHGSILVCNVLFLTSAMSALLGYLPLELLINILTRLNSLSQKAFHCVFHSSCRSVTSVLFNELFFDFDVGGTDGLVVISNYPHLAKHVRTIVLQRRNSLRKLDDF